MRNKRALLFKLALMAASAWFFTTIVVDFVAIPSVFKTIENNDLAGQVGVKVFAKYNILECIFAVLILPMAIVFKKLFIRVLSILLLLINISYISYFTPGISKASKELLKYEQSDSQLYDKASQALDFFHHAYVKIDGGKLILLLILIVLLFTINHTHQRDQQ